MSRKATTNVAARRQTAADLISPKSILLPYQRAWVDDDARFKIGMWARQTGKSFSCAAEAVEHLIKVPKDQWVVLSAGERQALEFMRKAREWAEAYQFAIADYVEDRESAEALIRSAEITWANGSRMLAIPANPDTARGYSANLSLDEFAFQEKPDEIWRAIYPSISNPLKGIKKIRIVSTPNGRANKFHDLWEKNQKYSHHKITIHDAVAAGLPLDIEELRAGLDDPEAWAQEYECQFIDSAAILLPYELIALCESQDASETIAFEYWQTTSPWPVDLGIDFGRKRDLTVCYAAEAVSDLQIAKEILCLQNMPTPEQIDILRPRIRKARRVCLDYTGPGTGMGDYLVKEFGEWDPEKHKFGKIELVTFSNNVKVDLFSKLRMSYEARAQRIPISRVLREDLHSVHRVALAAGGVTYRAPHNEDGHADRATAQALCVRARGYAGKGAILTVDGIRTGHRANAFNFRPRKLA